MLSALFGSVGAFFKEFFKTLVIDFCVGLVLRPVL